MFLAKRLSLWLIIIFPMHCKAFLQEGLVLIAILNFYSLSYDDLTLTLLFLLLFYFFCFFGYIQRSFSRTHVEAIDIYIEIAYK